MQKLLQKGKGIPAVSLHPTVTLNIRDFLYSDNYFLMLDRSVVGFQFVQQQPKSFFLNQFSHLKKTNKNNSQGLSEDQR